MHKLPCMPLTLRSCSYELPPPSAKVAEPSLQEAQQQWRARLEAQDPETALSDCLLRVYQVISAP